jgi:uncharacterized membrane protein
MIFGSWHEGFFQCHLRRCLPPPPKLIHLLSVFTPVMLVVAVVAARAHRVRTHKITMISIYAGALILAGLFTLVPGRLMHQVLFGS